MKEHKITIGTISKGFREETYLLKDDVNNLIDEEIRDYKKLGYQDEVKALEELKSKLNGENKK